MQIIYFYCNAIAYIIPRWSGDDTIMHRNFIYTSTTIFLWMSVLPTTEQNSSNEIFPSSSLSANRMVLSTICCSWVSFRLLPTIILRTCGNLLHLKKWFFYTFQFLMQKSQRTEQKLIVKIPYPTIF